MSAPEPASVNRSLSVSIGFTMASKWPAPEYNKEFCLVARTAVTPKGKPVLFKVSYITKKGGMETKLRFTLTGVADAKPYDLDYHNPFMQHGVPIRLLAAFLKV